MWTTKEFRFTVVSLRWFQSAGNCLTCGISKNKGHHTTDGRRNRKVSMCKIRWLRAKALSRRHGRQRDTVDRRRCHGRRLEPNNANASSSFELSEQEFCREVTQHDDDDDDDDGGDPLDRSGRQKVVDKSCVVCGCHRHFDSYGDRICWCDSCRDIELPWEMIRSLRLKNNIYYISDEDDHCAICGCRQHVDDVGDRTCWCDACSQSFPWQSAWRNIVKTKQQSVLLPSDDGDVSHRKEEE
jgi:hypothetical protein